MNSIYLSMPSSLLVRMFSERLFFFFLSYMSFNFTGFFSGVLLIWLLRRCDAMMASSQSCLNISKSFSLLSYIYGISKVSTPLWQRTVIILKAFNVILRTKKKKLPFVISIHCLYKYYMNNTCSVIECTRQCWKFHSVFVSL